MWVVFMRPMSTASAFLKRFHSVLKNLFTSSIFICHADRQCQSRELIHISVRIHDTRAEEAASDSSRVPENQVAGFALD
jgi:hypothetical protein